MTATTTTLPPPKSQDESFPVAAIVVLAVGGYIILFSIILIVRKCIINKTGGCCPEWLSEQCQCQSCFQNDPSQPGYVVRCAKECNCFKYPSKQQCMDSCCPTKQWCDDTFCFCMSQQPQGQCCRCDGCCTGLGCGDCFDCPECKDCCSDCKCECCAQPETIDCCCVEVKLSGSRGNRGPQSSMQGPGGYGGYPMPGAGYGPYTNQPGSFYQGGGPPVSQQPGWGGTHHGSMNAPSMGFHQGYSASQMMQSGSFRGMGSSMMNASMNNMGGANMFQATSSNSYA